MKVLRHNGIETLKQERRMIVKGLRFGMVLCFVALLVVGVMPISADGNRVYQKVTVIDEATGQGVNGVGVIRTWASPGAPERLEWEFDLYHADGFRVPIEALKEELAKHNIFVIDEIPVQFTTQNEQGDGFASTPIWLDESYGAHQLGALIFYPTEYRWKTDACLEFDYKFKFVYLHGIDDVTWEIPPTKWYSLGYFLEREQAARELLQQLYKQAVEGKFFFTTLCSYCDYDVFVNGEPAELGPYGPGRKYPDAENCGTWQVPVKAHVNIQADRDCLACLPDCGDWCASCWEYEFKDINPGTLITIFCAELDYDDDLPDFVVQRIDETSYWILGDLLEGMRPQPIFEHIPEFWVKRGLIAPADVQTSPQVLYRMGFVEPSFYSRILGHFLWGKYAEFAWAGGNYAKPSLPKHRKQLVLTGEKINGETLYLDVYKGTFYEQRVRITLGMYLDESGRNCSILYFPYDGDLGVLVPAELLDEELSWKDYIVFQREGEKIYKLIWQ